MRKESTTPKATTINLNPNGDTSRKRPEKRQTDKIIEDMEQLVVTNRK